MTDKLTALKKFTTIVADTGDISMIKLYHPQDATTNPSLILSAISNPTYHKLIHDAIVWARKKTANKKKQIEYASDKVVVNIGAEILKYIPGRISTEIDARLSYDIDASYHKAKTIVKLYNEIGIETKSILIKLASTWQGIRAAELLEQEGIHCNLTLIFSFAQARACADAGVFLISPFVGRISDWYKNKKYDVNQDPGILFVTKIYKYYKQYNYATIIMGASFRNINQILNLAGCDYLTISPTLLQELSIKTGTVERKLFFQEKLKMKPENMKESEFLWQHHQDPMAVEKLAEGIRNFSLDQQKLEKIISDCL